MLRLELVTSLPQLERHEPEWRALHAGTPNASPFQSFAWSSLWIRHFADPDSLMIWLYFDGARMVGAIPLCVRREHRRGLTFDVLRWVGDPDASHQAFLIDPAFRSTVLDRWLSDLRTPPRRWDVLDLRELPCVPGSEAADVRDTETLFASGGFRARAELGAHCSYIHCSGDFAELLRTTSSVIRKGAPYNERRLAKVGRIDVLRLSQGALDVAGALRAAQELHLKSRQASLGVGLFRDARRGAFYSAFLSALGKDEVEASVLHLNGRPVAYCLYLCYSGTRLLLGTQYDLEYARFSPGAVLFYLDVQYWFAQPGGIVLDLARGRFSWKRQWTSSVRRNHNVMVYASSIKARVLDLKRRASRYAPRYLQDLQAVRRL